MSKPKEEEVKEEEAIDYAELQKSCSHDKYENGRCVECSAREK